ncbi:MAG: hypothetical protein GXP32_03375, partial [Kiritimatiellaeota bacterium]|nr:hypothetical protein [Kiritimatiellota bacterium]
FHMLSGNFPRKVVGSDTAMLAVAETGDVDWGLCPVVENALSLVLKKMLSLDPEDRYAETGELARELEYFIYRKGYGPTNVTLSEYLREQVPYIFENDQGSYFRTIVKDAKTVEMAGYVI